MRRASSMSVACRLSYGILILLFVSTLAAVEEKRPAFPEGSEKAVKAVKDALPKAVIDAVSRPKGFGDAGPKEAPLFWSVQIHLGDEKQDLSVTPEGTIVRLPTTVEMDDLPKAIKDAIAKAAPDAKLKKAEKQETRATLRYRALEKPRMTYVVDVAAGEKNTRVFVGADGTVLQKAPLLEKKNPGKGELPTVGPDTAGTCDDKKKPEIPEAAAKAVKAVQDEFPDAEITGVENVGYQDGTGSMEVLNYEVEFRLKDMERELNVTPDGVIIHLDSPVAVKDLPKAVADAVAKEIPDGKIEGAFKQEVRAGLKFTPLEKAKVLYVVMLEQDKKPSVLKLLPDGTVVKEINPFGKKKEEGKDKTP
jgi:hypothetical protein